MQYIMGLAMLLLGYGAIRWAECNTVRVQSLMLFSMGVTLAIGGLITMVVFRLGEAVQ